MDIEQLEKENYRTNLLLDVVRDIINGKASDQSKIEVLKDLFIYEEEDDFI